MKAYKKGVLSMFKKSKYLITARDNGNIVLKKKKDILSLLMTFILVSVKVAMHGKLQKCQADYMLRLLQKGKTQS